MPGFSGNRNAWESHYTRTQSKQSYPDENVIRFFFRYFRSKFAENPFILDLGCGSGRHLKFLRENFNCRAIGQDYSLNAVKGFQNVVLADAVELPYQDGLFDVILIWGVLHYLHAADRAKAIDELNRVVKQRGFLVLTLRSDDDTHLATAFKKGDLKGGRADYFSKDEALGLFSGFSKIDYGYQARVPVGAEKMIAHHILVCQK